MVFVERLPDALDTSTQALHKVRAILQNRRKSAVAGESYSGFESSLPDHDNPAETLGFFVFGAHSSGNRLMVRTCGCGDTGPRPGDHADMSPKRPRASSAMIAAISA